MEGIIRLDNVSFEYKNRYQCVKAINNVSQSFDTGKTYAIIGKSGSGKTTMLSLMAGLALPTSGDVFYMDTPTSKLDRDKYRRDNVTVIYQTFNLFPLLTVMENVMYPLELQGYDKEYCQQKAQETISVVGLTSKVYRRFPNMLSGGERQRVAIARALTTKANVILADEPTGNIDSENSSNVISLLFSLAHQKDYCVVVVTHDLTIADKADVVLTVKDGIVKR